MKAIIIQEADASNLLDLLKLQKFQECEYLTKDGKSTDELIREIHQKFHYIVTRWLQEQGADAVRLGR